MERYVLDFDMIDRTQLCYVGGKGANLGEMARAGFPVPKGFCISTYAYRDFIAGSSQMDSLLEQLDKVSYDDLEQIRVLSQSIRKHMESLDMPDGIKISILDAWDGAGRHKAYAVRSSATAEDLPGASFAGQQETYLNVKGEEKLLEAVKRCWSSLFTDRAISYRAKNGFSHRSVYLSVVVQQMVFPEASGIMFTSDPITGRRKTISIDAGFGLGEALVSGIVSADLYQVRDGKIIKKQISEKKIEICPMPEGGTVTRDIPPERQQVQVLTDDRIMELSALGQKLRDYYGSEQDIEWCLENGKFYIVQSRPITSLYPVPEAMDGKAHILLSFGHVQMMTEVIKPLGISVMRTLFPFGKSSPEKESGILLEAGGRLFIDMDRVLMYRRLARVVPLFMENADVMMSLALKEYMKRQEFKEAYLGKRLKLSHFRTAASIFFPLLRTILFSRVENRVDEVNKALAGHLKETEMKLQDGSGADRIGKISEVLGDILPDLFRKGIVINIAAGIGSYKLIESLSKRWLKDVPVLADISKSPPGNVTTEMGLALGDAADEVRKYPKVAEYLEQADDETFMEGLKGVAGGGEAMDSLVKFFEKYGMRATGEIDITRPRWREAPTQIIPVILSSVKSAKPGQHRLDFEAGRCESDEASKKLLEMLKNTPGGFLKMRIMRRLIKVHRSVIGIREHPKYHIIQVLDLVKKVIMEEADKLVKDGILSCREEIFWFTMEDIQNILKNSEADRSVIESRKEKYERDSKLTPPRVITSYGEIITARYGSSIPEGALPGSPASAGIIEGTARVVLKLEDAKLQKGDILVAPYTDPAWTALFPLSSGLVTEVGGLMTHGAVVAREYGIPAVVGVDNATKTIRDGAHIRVNGTEGYVEIMEN